MSRPPPTTTTYQTLQSGDGRFSVPLILLHRRQCPSGRGIKYADHATTKEAEFYFHLLHVASSSVVLVVVVIRSIHPSERSCEITEHIPRKPERKQITWTQIWDTERRRDDKLGWRIVLILRQTFSLLSANSHWLVWRWVGDKVWFNGRIFKFPGHILKTTNYFYDPLGKCPELSILRLILFIRGSGDGGGRVWRPLKLLPCICSGIAVRGSMV